jgi:hypothetical protein
VLLVFMGAQGLEPPLTLVCSDLHLVMEGYPVNREWRLRSRCCRQGRGDHRGGLGEGGIGARAVVPEPEGPGDQRPRQKHTLSHYRRGSTDSALEAACVYYAGVQLLLPGQDPGLDLGRE